MALFGPAGLADSFKTKGYKKSIQVADYLSEFGLTAFEYQAGRGVKIGTEAAKPLPMTPAVSASAAVPLPFPPPRMPRAVSAAM